MVSHLSRHLDREFASFLGEHAIPPQTAYPSKKLERAGKNIDAKHIAGLGARQMEILSTSTKGINEENGKVGR